MASHGDVIDVYAAIARALLAPIERRALLHALAATTMRFDPPLAHRLRARSVVMTEETVNMDHEDT